MIVLLKVYAKLIQTELCGPNAFVTQGRHKCPLWYQKEFFNYLTFNLVNVDLTLSKKIGKDYKYVSLCYIWLEYSFNKNEIQGLNTGGETGNYI